MILFVLLVHHARFLIFPLLAFLHDLTALLVELSGAAASAAVRSETHLEFLHSI